MTDEQVRLSSDEREALDVVACTGDWACLIAQIEHLLKNRLASVVAQVRWEEALWWANGEHPMVRNGTLYYPVDPPCARCERMRALAREAEKQG